MNGKGTKIDSTRGVTPKRRGSGPRMAAVVFAASLLAGCGGGSGEPGVLATVDGVPVTEAALRHHWGGRGPANDTPAARRELLDQLIERTALAQRARAAGLADDPEVVAQFENLLGRRLRELELGPQLAAASVAEAEVAARYESDRDHRYSEPARDRLAVLWFRTRGQAPLAERYRPRLEDARRAVAENPGDYPAGSGFGALAVNASEHQATRYRGGDLGWMETRAGAKAAAKAPGAFRATVANVGRGLASVGDVSRVVETPEGLLVVRLVDRDPGGARPLPEVRDQIARALLSEKRRALEEAFDTRALEGVAVVRHEAHLDALQDLAPAAEPPGRPQSKLATLTEPTPTQPDETP